MIFRTMAIQSMLVASNRGFEQEKVREFLQIEAKNLKKCALIEFN